MENSILDAKDFKAVEGIPDGIYLPLRFLGVTPKGTIGQNFNAEPYKIKARDQIERLIIRKLNS